MNTWAYRAILGSNVRNRRATRPKHSMNYTNLDLVVGSVRAIDLFVL